MSRESEQHQMSKLSLVGLAQFFHFRRISSLLNLTTFFGLTLATKASKKGEEVSEDLRELDMYFWAVWVQKVSFGSDSRKKTLLTAPYRGHRQKWSIVTNCVPSSFSRKSFALLVAAKRVNSHLRPAWMLKGRAVLECSLRRKAMNFMDLGHYQSPD